MNCRHCKLNRHFALEVLGMEGKNMLMWFCFAYDLMAFVWQLRGVLGETLGFYKTVHHQESQWQQSAIIQGLLELGH